MDLRILLKIVGGLVIVLGVLLAIPTLYALFTDGVFTVAFVKTMGVAVCSGGALWAVNRNYHTDLNHRTGFGVVAASWIAACLLGALPYYFSGALPEFLNAFFESTSGFSGTGASVITDIDSVPGELLLWRSMTQWLGGMGIIVFFIAILPALGLGSVQLFKAEVTGPGKDKITPRVRETARQLWLLYVIFTVALTMLLCMAGMSGFDAINHAMTTLSTGGFSTRGAGIMAFDNVIVEYLILVFMLISSINFGLHYRIIVQGDREALFATELKWYLVFVAASAGIVTFAVWDTQFFSGFEPALRSALFTVICTVSSTGYTNYNYVEWPYLTHTVIVFLMLMGGMSGSTAGGLKCIRVVTMVKQVLKELRQTVHPSAVLTLKTDSQSMQARIQNTIWGFIFIYFFATLIVVVVLTFGGSDLVSATTAAVSAFSNIGPGLGALGPYDNYSALPEASKLALCAAMLFGRLEFYTLLVLLTPEFWRK